MMKRFLALTLVLASSSFALAKDWTTGMERGQPKIASITSMSFGPNGILFVGDSQSAMVFAIATGDEKLTAKGPVNLEKFDEKVAAMLGTKAENIVINDVKVNPASGVIYVGVTRSGENGGSVILTVQRDGSMQEMSLKNVLYSSVKLTNIDDKQVRSSITDLAFVEVTVVVSGLSNEEFASTLRVISFPFKEAGRGAGVQIFHGAHGRFETRAPVRTFTPYTVNGTGYLLAAYTCTPLVRIPMVELQKDGAKVKGITVAELGNRNRPLDMFTYNKGGKGYILMANSARGVMKIPTEGIEQAAAITTPIRGGKSAGVTYETVKELSGVVQLDKLDEDHALILQTDGRSQMTLKSVTLP